MMVKIRFLLLVMFLLSLLVSTQASALSIFKFDSDQGSYLGLGKSFNSDSLQRYNFGVRNYGDNGLHYNIRWPEHYWCLDLTAPDRGYLTLGEYTASRWPFNNSDEYGFSFYGEGRGYNRSYSEIEILDIKYHDLYSFPVSFAINFSIWPVNSSGLPICDQGLYGQLRYFSDIPLDYAAPVPEPASLLLLGTGLIGLAGAGRRKIKIKK